MRVPPRRRRGARVDEGVGDRVRDHVQVPGHRLPEPSSSPLTGRRLRTSPASRKTDGPKLRADVDRTPDTAGHWTLVRVEAVHPLDYRPVGSGVEAQVVADAYALDHEDLAIQLDLPLCVGAETTVSGWDAARLKRAPESADESTRCRRHDVVQGGRVRWAVLG